MVTFCFYNIKIFCLSKTLFLKKNLKKFISCAYYSIIVILNSSLNT